MFGHTVRGPLRILREQLLEKSVSLVLVLDYVSKVRDRLYQACAMAKENLVTAQNKMKSHFDKRKCRTQLSAWRLVVGLSSSPRFSNARNIWWPL